jgi:hypothetical protein
MTAHQSSSLFNDAADQIAAKLAETAATRFWTASQLGRLCVRHGDFEVADEWASSLFKESADAIVGRRAQQAALEIWAAIEAEKGRVGADLLRATL